MENMECVVERITYQNDESGYSILKVSTEGDKNNLVTLVGNLANVVVGAALRVEGEWKVHPQYGMQFAAERYEETVPATVHGIEKYLGSGMVKGIGAGYANKIVAQFGLDTLDIIENHPERLTEVKGLGKKRINKIVDSWNKQRDIQNIMLFLQGHNVSPSLAVKIYKQYGGESISVVKKNPYRLADEVWGVGFKLADTIAENLGLEKENPFRIQSGILYTLSQMASDGHVFATCGELQKKAAEMLDVSTEVVERDGNTLIEDERMLIEGDAAYLPVFLRAEKAVANGLLALKMKASKKTYDVDVAQIEAELGIQFDDVQANAIKTAANSKVMVLTGLPGTGKTTTVNGIIKAFEMQGKKIRLAAPTGRAAKRMTESTGKEAATIHRLLEYKLPDGFSRNKENPLEGDVLIVDECSMIDILLMSALVKAIPQKMTLIMVGDTDQLPSVGAGNVLNDVIASGVFPVVKLTRIFRQAATSQIVTNSHRINAGEMPVLSNQRDTDFWFIECEEPEEISEQIVSLVSKRLPKYCHCDPKDIQVLTPMKKSPIGTDALNVILQESLNPGMMCLKQGGREFRRRDRVMQIRNNYEKDVFNGDVGVIEDVNLEDKEILVSFDGKLVLYEMEDLDELVHAYAVTIHKSQGSEYPIVVMPVSMQHFIMLQRNLIYTGITRAKKMIVLVGTKKAIAHSVRNVTVSKRNTHLKERLQGKTI